MLVDPRLDLAGGWADVTEPGLCGFHAREAAVSRTGVRCGIVHRSARPDASTRPAEFTRYRKACDTSARDAHELDKAIAAQEPALDDVAIFVFDFVLA
jgi:hypothetical protein